jgi:hypothetical protein
MRCPTCGQDADPANAFCPYCRTALHLPSAPSSPYADPTPPQWGGAPEYRTQPPQWSQPAESTYPPGYGQPQAYVPQQGYEPQPGYEPHPGYQPQPGYQQPAYQHQGYPPPPQAGMPQQPGWADSYQVLEPGPPPERPRSSWPWLVVIIAVLVVLAGAAVAIVKLAGRHNLPIATGTARPSTVSTAPSQPGGDGKAEANAIDQLLNASSASRQKLAPALTAVDGCGDVNGALGILQQVTAERNNQVKQGQALAVDQLTNGTQLRTALVQALTYSLQADQKYTAWAQAVAGAGCTGHAPHDDNYAAAQAASGSATTSKQQFVALWNPVASTYGLQARSESTV